MTTKKVIVRWNAAGLLITLGNMIGDFIERSSRDDDAQLHSVCGMPGNELGAAPPQRA
jgi:hypothetical protein